MVAYHFKSDFRFVYSVLSIHFENFSALCAIIMCKLIDRTVYFTVHLTECRWFFFLFKSHRFALQTISPFKLRYAQAFYGVSLEFAREIK